MHHHGIFWGWEQIYIGDQKIGHGWKFVNFSQEVSNVTMASFADGSAALTMQVAWISPNWTDENGKPEPFVDERDFVRIYRATAKKRVLDFEITLRALTKDVRFGGASNEKAYGGFSLQIRQPGNIVFIGQNGNVVPQRTPVTAGPWLDMVTTFMEGGSESGVAVFCHPSNPGFPQPWVIRKRRSMQNVVSPGRQPIPIPQDQPIVLRYRVIIHSHAVSPEEIQQFFDEYAAIDKISR